MKARAAIRLPSALRWPPSRLHPDQRKGTRRARRGLRIRVDADEAQALNQDYRDKDYVPNVLTFEYGEVGHDESGRGVLGGDVVICAEVVEREAREQGKPLQDHYAHMTVHGVLHLQGYDHIDQREADIMEMREAVILKRFRIPNPYSS